MAYYIRKSSGEKERFDREKFKNSLLKAGAKLKEINEIVKLIEKTKPKTTKQIHEIVTQVLQKKQPVIAHRYNLKRALMELGPAGYSFEQFVSQLMAAQGFKALTNQIEKGNCVEHEVDVVATKQNKHFMIECKFHNRPGLKSDVKVALYIYARFQDIHDAWKSHKEDTHKFHQAWIVTNTKFTQQAVIYGKCKNIKMIDWAFPKKESLASMIEQTGLHPITTLTSLTRSQKKTLIRQGFILCKDVRKYKNALKSLGLTQRASQKLLSESEQICKIKPG